MYVFSYKIRAYDFDDHKNYTTCGLGFADSYADAAEQLERQFGKDIVEILSLYLMEESNIIALPEEVVEDYKATDFPDITYIKEIGEEA